MVSSRRPSAHSLRSRSPVAVAVARAPVPSAAVAPRRARRRGRRAGPCRRCPSPPAPRRTCPRSRGPRRGGGRCGRARGRPRPPCTLSSSPRLTTSSTVFDPLAGRDVRDVQQAVGALRELDEGAERGGLDDLAGELVADLDLLGHLADAVDQRVALLAGLGVDADGAVVVDVDLGLELLRQRPDRLAALADHRADLLGVDLDLRDARRVRRQLARAARRSRRPSCRGSSCARPSPARARRAGCRT